MFRPSEVQCQTSLISNPSKGFIFTEPDQLEDSRSSCRSINLPTTFANSSGRESKAGGVAGISSGISKPICLPQSQHNRAPDISKLTRILDTDVHDQRHPVLDVQSCIYGVSVLWTSWIGLQDHMLNSYSMALAELFLDNMTNGKCDTNT